MKHRLFFLGIFFSHYVVLSYAKFDLIEIPYWTAGKTMVIEGMVNGKAGDLIFDTGIPKMLLNQKHVGNSEVFKNKEFAGFQSINGANHNGGMSLVLLQIRGFSKKVGADIVDLGTVEEHKGINILAIVGIDLFKKYELEIDGFSKVIRLYRLSKKGNRIVQEKTSLPSLTIPFDNKGHLPCISTQWNGRTLRLGLDTGAEAHVLNHDIYETSKDRFDEVHTVCMVDLNGKPSKVLATEVDGIKIGYIEVPSTETLFMPNITDYGGLSSKKVQGLLGFAFFQHFRMALNFKKKEFSLWKRELVGLQ
ncbi:MAG: hypothetical protein HKN76_05575 [Saprospiraceae bacterium]|nr:hypothetical protein [Saprospiraceae bacterium]